MCVGGVMAEELRADLNIDKFTLADGADFTTTFKNTTE